MKTHPSTFTKTGCLLADPDWTQVRRGAIEGNLFKEALECLDQNDVKWVMKTYIHKVKPYILYNHTCHKTPHLCNSVHNKRNPTSSLRCSKSPKRIS